MTDTETSNDREALTQQVVEAMTAAFYKAKGDTTVADARYLMAEAAIDVVMSQKETEE